MLSVHQLRQNLLEHDIHTVYTYDALKNWPLRGTILGIIGDPIEHSQSPQLHQQFLTDLAATDPQFLAWKYIKCHIRSEELRYILPFFYSRGVRGLNITCPHKQAVIPWLSSISDTAQLIGAVNCLTYTPMGYVGDNFDAEGFMTAIIPLLLKNPHTPLVNHRLIDWKELSALIWGCGGAARACLYALIQAGIKKCYIGNRSPERLERFKHDFSRFDHVEKHFFLLNEPPKNLSQIPLWIQTTSLGLNKTDPLPIPIDHIPLTATVYDVVYHPEKTHFIQELKKRGITADDGWTMLVAQAKTSFKQWTHPFLPCPSSQNTIA
jgi:shikimate dehydrogenase